MADVAALKRELIALGAATEVGFAAGGADVERIKSLAAALEAVNPTAEPAHAAALLRGRWRLIYSSFGLQRHTTLARLSFNLLPKQDIEVDELFQEVDPATGLYDNVVGFRGGGEAGVNVTLGRFAPAGPQRLEVEFTDAAVAMPSLRQSVPIANAKLPPMHSDVTYLDDDFRLNRGSFGNLYVLQLVERAPATWSRSLTA
jgi:hypothetical protein